MAQIVEQIGKRPPTQGQIVVRDQQPVEQHGTQRPTQEQIAARAYEIYLARGGQPGREIDDWLQAEYELLQLPIHKIAELDTPKSSGQKDKRAVMKRSTLVALVHLALTLGSTRLR